MTKHAEPRFEDVYFSTLEVGDKFRSQRYEDGHYDSERIADRITGTTYHGTVNCKQLDNGLLSGMGRDVVVGKFVTA